MLSEGHRLTLAKFAMLKAKATLLRRRDPIGERVFGYSANNGGTGDTRKALVCYISNVFAWSPDDPRLRGHVNRLQALAIARILTEYGFTADVIDCRDTLELPSYDYDLMLGHDPAFSAHARRVRSGCVRVFYATTQPGPLMRRKIIERYEEEAGRTGRTRRCLRLPPLPGETCGVATADWLFYKGDEYCLSLYEQYGFSDENSHLIANGVGYTVPVPVDRDYAAAKKGFLYFGSWGAIFRGLDRVLEVFGTMPEATLHVCGPLLHDTGFVVKYRKLLFNTRNIRCLGFVDPQSDGYRSLVSRCASTIYPSPSEGSCSSVIIGMHAGLMPIVGRDCSVIMPDWRLLLEDYSIEHIRSKVKMVCAMPAPEVKALCGAAMQNARLRYSWAAFESSLRRGMERIMCRHF